MPTCEHCGKEWKWKETMKATFTLNHALYCPYCERQQFITKQSKRKLHLLNFIIPLNFLLFLFIDIPGIFKISMLFGTGAILILIYPFMIRLSSKDDLLW